MYLSQIQITLIDERCLVVKQTICFVSYTNSLNLLKAKLAQSLFLTRQRLWRFKCVRHAFLYFNGK